MTLKIFEKTDNVMLNNASIQMLTKDRAIGQTVNMGSLDPLNF